MILKAAGGAAAVLVATALAFPAPATAHRLKERDSRPVARDCKPYNGPFGYYGNPWCERGWKYAEDYAPGQGPYFDIFDLPQLRHHHRRGYWD